MAGRHAAGRASWHPRQDIAEPWDTRRGRDDAVGRHDTAKRPFLRRIAARKRAGKAVPAAAIAATLAAGAAAYVTMTTGSVPAGNELTAAMVKDSAGSPAIQARSSAPAGDGRTSAAAQADFARTLSANMAAGRHAVSGVARHVAAKKAAASPGSTATASRNVSRRPAALTCNTARGMLPANVTAIVSFLLAHGYTHNAAAGVAGNIYRESHGDPESVGTGGGGLIGWTPLPSGFVTGNPAADLRTQLSAILKYNQGWAQYIPALNAASSPAAAADIYVTDFERAGIPAASERESSASAVASACGL